MSPPPCHPNSSLLRTLSPDPRYTAFGRRDAIAPAFEALLGVVDEVYSIELPDVERARDLLLAATELSARDALHADVMEHRSVTSILTFDRGFDALAGINRLT